MQQQQRQIVALLRQQMAQKKEESAGQSWVVKKVMAIFSEGGLEKARAADDRQPAPSSAEAHKVRKYVVCDPRVTSLDTPFINKPSSHPVQAASIEINRDKLKKVLDSAEIRQKYKEIHSILWSASITNFLLDRERQEQERRQELYGSPEMTEADDANLLERVYQLESLLLGEPTSGTNSTALCTTSDSDSCQYFSFEDFVSEDTGPKEFFSFEDVISEDE